MAGHEGSNFVVFFARRIQHTKHCTARHQKNLTRQVRAHAKSEGQAVRYLNIHSYHPVQPVQKLQKATLGVHNIVHYM